MSERRSNESEWTFIDGYFMKSIGKYSCVVEYLFGSTVKISVWFLDQKYFIRAKEIHFRDVEASKAIADEWFNAYIYGGK